MPEIEDLPTASSLETSPDSILGIETTLINQALERIRIRKTQESEQPEADAEPDVLSEGIAEPTTPAGKLNKIRENPKSVGDHILVYICTNLEFLKKSLMDEEDPDYQVRNGLVAYLVDTYAYPDIKDKVKIANPKNKPEDFRRFVRNHLDKFLQKITKNLPGIGKGAKDNNKIAQFIDFIVPLLDFDTDEISLGELIDKIEDIMHLHFKATVSSWSPHFKEVGSFIYNSLKKFEAEFCDEIDAANEEDIVRFLDEVVYELSGVWAKDLEKNNDNDDDTEDGQDEEDSEGYLDLFDGLFDQLPRVKAQLQIHMTQRAVREKIFETYGTTATEEEPVEVRFFRNTDMEVFNGDIAQWGEEYLKAEPWKISKVLFGSRNKLGEEALGKTVNEEIEHFYKLAEYCYKLYEVGKVYMATGQYKEKGEIISEIALMYIEKLEGIAANLEVKLSVGDFVIDDLEALSSGLSGLLSSATLDRAIGVAQEAHKDMGLVEAAELEVESLHRP